MEKGQGADGLPEIVVTAKDYVAVIRGAPALGHSNHALRNIIVSATSAEPEPHQVPLLPLVWVIPESLQMPFPLQCVVGAVKPELTPILPPLSCPVIQPRSVSVSEIMWRRVFSRRSIERE